MVSFIRKPESLWAFKNIKYLLLATTISTFVLVVLGYVVRVTSSSYGCPDWPTCYGQYGLPGGISAQIQYLHRVVAIVATVMVFLTTAFVFWRYRHFHLLAYPMMSASTLFIVEIFSGGEIIRYSVSPLFSSFHLAIALIILAMTILATLSAYYAGNVDQGQLHFEFRSPYKKLNLVVFAGILALMVNGAFIISNHSAQSCAGRPFCNNGVFSLGGPSWVQVLHGVLAAITMITVGILFFKAWRSYRHHKLILTSTTAIAALFLGQMFIGYVKVLKGYPSDLVGVHATTTAALWATLCVLIAGVGLLDREANLATENHHVTSTYRQRLTDFVMLTKPFIVVLLLVTTVSGMIIGGKGLPTLQVLLWTVLAGALAAGGSSAINQYIDRDIDKKMQRTAKRPVASGRLYPAEGLAFGVGLCILSFFLFVGFVNLLAALLSLAGMVYYVLIYSIFLKKITIQNIVVGGGAGAIPPLVGWAAVTHGLNIPSLMLFAVVFFWTPPHFWALALVRVKDYARAGIPMLPVIKGERKTRIQIFIYTLELVGVTLLLPLFKLVGSLYLVFAIALGGLLVYFAWNVLAKEGKKTAWNMYRYSSIYLALLFLAMVLDVLLKKPG